MISLPSSFCFLQIIQMTKQTFRYQKVGRTFISALGVTLIHSITFSELYLQLSPLAGETESLDNSSLCTHTYL